MLYHINSVSKLQTGKKVGELLNKSLMESLLEEERQGSKRKAVGFLK
jgi:hypothetical protein